MEECGYFFVGWNRLQGTLPNGGGWLDISDLLCFSIAGNRFHGVLTEEGLQRISEILSVFEISSNMFEGVLPEEGLLSMKEAEEFEIGDNRFEGMLPEGGLRGFADLEKFHVGGNRFTGALPGSGMHKVSMLHFFWVYDNRFEGMLPHGLGGMLKIVRHFCINDNLFSGMLQQVFGRSASLNLWLVYSNKFSGTLPKIKAHGLLYLIASNNYFQGVVPRLRANLIAFVVSGTLMAGTVPGLLQQRRSLFLSMSGVIHKGTIPRLLSRMTGNKTSLVFGHGLTGSWPRIPTATLDVVSAWGNDLEGNLPCLHINAESHILLHSNRLSCKLPTNWGTNTEFSIALVGNPFEEPPAAYPPWVSAAEHSSLFCVSQQQGKDLTLKCFCGTSILTIVALGHRRQKGAESHQGVHGRSYHQYMLAKHSWCRSSYLLAPFSLAACILLLQYTSVGGFLCMVTFERLRFPTYALDRVALTAMELTVSLWLGNTLRLFHRATLQFENKHVLPLPRAARREGPAARRRGTNLVIGMTWNLWIVLCTLTSAPAAVYATVKAVPGALGMPGMLQWVVQATVSIFTASLTSLVLPLLAKLLCSVTSAEINVVRLQVFARILAIPVLPCVVTWVFHTDCLGAWTSVWQGCRSFISQVAEWKVDYYHHSQRVRHTYLLKGEACGLNISYKRFRCADAVQDRLMQLLLAKYLHQAFTIPTCRLISKARMKSRETCVLLVCVWLDAFMLGPCLPMLLPLLVLVVNVHIKLLFGRSSQLLSMEDDSSTGFTQFGIEPAVCFVVLLHYSVGFSSHES